MGRTRVLLLLATAAGLAGTPAPALAGPADVAATHAYIQANYTLVQGGKARIPRAEAATRKVLVQVRSECPLAAKGSPQDHDSEQLSDEVVGAIVVAAMHTGTAGVHTFVSTVQRMHWSNAALTRRIRGYAAHLKTISTLPAPNVCADVRAWVASGYQTLPASTVKFDAAYEPAWVAIGELPALLKPYERPEEQAVIRRSNALQEAIGDFEARAVETYASILDAMELKQ
ncbi:MAG TPA: hypothetical protein VES97_03615 [Solirubrobacteraceae bacterium]|nr:hypothetical protein [Solirubrobacteraceae bacterium]